MVDLELLGSWRVKDNLVELKDFVKRLPTCPDNFNPMKRVLSLEHMT
jgi:hypothetical protein